MAGKQTESTMKWKLDITDLKSNIQKANREIRVANSEFKNATAGMDDWGKSADGLGAKLKNLDSNYKSQEKILETLQEQYKLVAAEQGENSKQAQDLMVKINNQSASMQKTQKQIEKYSSLLEQMKSSESSAESATESLTKMISKQEKELSDLKSQYQESALTKGKDSDASKELASRISSLSSDLQKNKIALNDASYAGDDLSDSLDDVNTSSDHAGGGFTILKGALAGLVAEGLKVAIEGLKELASEGERASASFQASTGASKESMTKYNEVMQELYKSNFGDSLDDIAESMSEVKRQTNEVDPTILKDLTKNAIGLRDTFDMDVKESVRAVKMMMDQFGISGEEAFNLVVQGAQKGLDKNGDLLDSINEYSPYYKAQGYSAEEFFNSLENGTKAGTFSVDKLGDAMKEFGIRTKDTAATTTEGFELIGLDADKMRKKFAEGGEAARIATDDVINALFSMDDQVKQNQAGVALFGTMWEDLGKDGIQSLTMVSGSADKTKNSMEQLNKVKYSDVGNQTKELGRLVKTEIFVPMAQQVLPVIKDGITWTIKNAPRLVPIIKTVGTAIAAAFVVKTIVGFKSGIIDAGKSLTDFGEKVPLVGKAMSSLGAYISANPWVILATAVAGVTVAIGGFIMQSTAENDQHKQNMDILNEEAKSWEELKEKQNEQITTGLGEINNLQSLNSELKNLVDANGNVKEGYESRVQFILNELNAALGTEMALNDGVIKGYKDLDKSIDDLLVKKKAEVILEAQLPAYKEAVTKSIEAQSKANQLATEIADNNMKSKQLEMELLAKYGEGWISSTEAMSTSTYKQLNILSQDTVKKKEEYDTQNGIIKGYHDSINLYEINSMRLQSGNAKEIAKIDTDIVASKGKSYDEQISMLEAKNSFEKEGLDDLKQKYKETGDETLKQMIDSKTAAIENTQKKIDGMKTTVEEKKPELVTAYEVMAQASVDALNKKAESETKGAENADSYGIGISSKTSVVQGAGIGLNDSLLSGLGTGNYDVKLKGEEKGLAFKTGADGVSMYEVGDHYSQGIQNGTGSIDFFTLGITIGDALLKGTREALDEHSPSREGDEIGDFYVQGIAGGVVNNIKKLKSAINKMGTVMLKDTKNIALETSSVLSGAIGSLNTSNQLSVFVQKKSEANDKINSSPVTYNQYNYSPKALSRMEIYRQTKSALFKGGKK